MKVALPPQLLATTLKSSEASFEAKIAATKSAMEMVAEKTLDDAEIKIAELQAQHQNEIKLLQEQLVLAKDQSKSFDQVVSWLRPIYTNQNRNYRQLQELTAAQNKQAQKDLPETKTSALEKPNPIDRNILPSSVKMASKALADNRAGEISKLKQELEVIDARLSRLVVQPTQRASHLEPVYVPKGQLVPILDVPKRHSLPKKLEPSQRFRRIR